MKLYNRFVRSKSVLQKLFLCLFFGFVSGVSAAQGNVAKEMGLTDYQYFIIYPHLEKGFSALKNNNKQRAISELKSALELAPNNIALIIHLVEAHRHFGDDDAARMFLEDQIKRMPGSEALVSYLSSMHTEKKPIETLDDLHKAQQECVVDPKPQCRTRVSYAALALEQLEFVVEQLENAEFRASDEGQKLQDALLQRALFLRNWSLVDRLFEAESRQADLTPADYEQWFYALWQGELDSRFLALQSRGVFVEPNDYINYAAYLLTHEKHDALDRYLAENQPLFKDEIQERSWVFLLMSSEQNFAERLKNYRPRFPENRHFIAVQLLPKALKGETSDYLDRVLADLPEDEYLHERYQLSLMTQNLRMAQDIAKRIYDTENRTSAAIDIYSWRLQSLGAEQRALDTLLYHYPFSGAPELVAKLTARLHGLSEKYRNYLSPTQKQWLQQPLGSPELREMQAQLSWVSNNCSAITALLGDYHHAYSAYAWGQLAECHRKDVPGLAVYLFERAAATEPSSHRTKSLAYQYFEVKDYASALASWKNIPFSEMTDGDLQAATLTAELADDEELVLKLLSAQKQRNLDSTHSFWLSKARLGSSIEKKQVLENLNRSIGIKATPAALALRADIYRSRGDSDSAERDLLHAIDLDPDNRLHAAALGYLLWDEDRLTEAKSLQEYALAAMPYDIDLVKQMSYIGERLDQPADTQRYIKQVVDDLDYHAEIKPLTKQQRQERFNFRRMHEDVARKWTINANSTIGLSSNSLGFFNQQSGALPQDNYRSFGQIEAEYRIGKNKIVQDDLLSVYGRVFADSQETSGIWPTKTPMLGVGVRWKPWRDRVIFAAAEQQTPLGHKGRTDTLLRLSASFLNDGKYSDDWHPHGKGWLAQNLYLDAGHYIRDNTQVWTADYRLSWHQKIKQGQTIEPYVHLQTQGNRRKHSEGDRTHTKGGHIVGFGVRWNLWFGETHYSSWPRKISIGLETQQFIKTINMDARKKNNILLTFGLRW